MAGMRNTPPDRGNPEALGQSEAFLDFQERLSRVAAVDRPVLLVGERGTGKELAARRLHFLSRRWEAPLAALNCAALSSTLIESELFGYEPGAFTGAVGRRRGRFETAEGGTLFLDELGNIPLFVQEKILRVVEYGVFERVGGSDPVSVDVRIIGATNVNLPVLVDQGRFMRDLLDRLSFEVLFLPPLRERREDILLLATHFAARMALELGRTDLPRFTPEVETKLEAHPWPGNVRELKNVVERAVYRAAENLVDTVCFDPFTSPFEPAPNLTSIVSGPVRAEIERDESFAGSFTKAVEGYEVMLLQQALLRCNYNQREAASFLGLTYDQFRGLYRKFRNRLKR